MNYLLTGFLFVLFIGWLAVTLGVAVLATMGEGPFSTLKARAIAGMGAFVSLSLWSSVIMWAAGNSDQEEHCGPGTIYRESAQYNPSTKTTDFNWWCEAK